jgi:ABC-type transporter Mla maintaining outer membrane lipid asymmetry ATPase subunit MlaF
LKGEQPTQPIALETAHLSRAVVGKVLTDDINVQVQVGEVVAVVGPSGPGKSSFLRLPTQRSAGELIKLPRYALR